MPEDGHLFFDELISSYVVENSRYLARGWLADRITVLLGDPQCRFVLMTAPPGAGKTAMVAGLAHDHPGWPRYFVRRDQSTPLEDPGAVSFLLRTGFQFAALHPELFSLEQIKVSIEQHLGDVGNAAGADVARLVASPFHQVVVEIRQQVEAAGGGVVGLRVGEWVADPRLQAPAELQFLALIDPARKLARERPDEQLVILVDGLDELHYYEGGPSLLDWLAKCPELPANVRFLLTSRPDDKLLALFRESQKPWLRELPLDPDAVEVRRDIRRYARALAAEPTVAAALGSAGTKRFINRAIDKARGNVGYLDAVGRAIDQAAERKSDEQLARALDLAAFPNTLEGLYASFLHEIRRRMGDRKIRVVDRDTGKVGYIEAWPALYLPVLGVLAVAREPLVPAQLRIFGSIPSDPAEALEELRQFLERRGGRVRLYHAALAQFLTADSTRDNDECHDLYQEPAEWHRNIVLAIRAGAASWETKDWRSADDYALSQVSAHLLALSGDEQAHRWLYELICRPFMQAKFVRYGSHAAFAVDVDRAATVARSQGDVVEEVRCAMVYANLSDIAADLPGEALAALSQIGRAAQAEAFASLIAEDDARAEAYRLIAAGRLRRGDRDDAEKAFEWSVSAAKAIPYPRWRFSALLASAEGLLDAGAGPRAMTATETLLAHVEDIANEDDHAQFLAGVARVLARCGDARAFAFAERLYDDERDRCLISICAALMERGDFGRALVSAARIGDGNARERALDEIRMHCTDLLDLAEALADPLERALALGATAWRLARRGESEAAIAPIDGALGMVASLPMEPARSEIECAVAEALALLGQHARAVDVARRIQHGMAGTSALRAVAIALVRAGDVERAIDIISGLEDGDIGKDDIIQAVALALAESGRSEAAMSAADLVSKLPVIASNGEASIDATEHLWNAHRAMLLRAIAHRFSDAGHFQSAVDAADRAADASARAGDGYAGATAARTEMSYALASSGKIEQALRMLEGAGDPRLDVLVLDESWQRDDRVASLVDLAALVAEVGKLDEVIEVATHLDDARGEAVIEVAQRMSAAGRTDLALALADRGARMDDVIHDGFRRASMLRAAATIFADAGEWDRADELTVRVDSDSPYDGGQLRLYMVRAALNRGAFDRAFAVMRQVGPDSFDRPEMLADAATDLVQAGRWSDAVALANDMKGATDPDLANKIRARSLSHVALALANAGLDHDARDVAEAVLVTPPDEAPLFVPAALSEIALALVAADCAEAASDIAERALALAQTHRDRQQLQRQIADTAIILAAAGQSQRSFAIIDQLDTDGRIEALVTAAGQLTRAGHGELALAFAERAHQLASSNGFDSDFAAPEIACARAAKGDGPAALTIVAAIGNSKSKQEALTAMAETLISAGLAAGLLAVTNAIDDDFDRRWALRSVGLAFARAGDVENALAASDGLDGDMRLHVLAAAARALHRANRDTDARTLANKALALSKLEQDDSSMFGFRYAELGELARALVDVGRRAPALAILKDLLRAGYDNETIKAGVAPAFAYAGEDKRAISIMNEIGGMYVVRDDAMRELAPLLVRHGHTDGLLHAVRSGGALPRAIETMLPTMVEEGQIAESLQVWRACLDQARTKDAETVFQALAAGALPIVSLDRGATLHAACEAAFAVNGWWRVIEEHQAAGG